MKKRLTPKNNALGPGNKPVSESKITKASLILEYAFEYDVNFKERTILISGEINHATFEIVDAAMTEMEAESKKTITIRINSPGGEVYQALAVIGRMRRSPCHIVTEGYGHVMSAATLILAAGDRRKVSKFCFFMVHEMSYRVSGKHSEVKHEVNEAERTQRLWNEWMGEFTQKPKTFWGKRGVWKDAYYGADKLVEFGVADEIF